MRRIEVAERRARLGRRHLLAPSARAGDVVDVARALVAVHGTDPASAYLGTWARMTAGSRQAVESALYDRRELIRLLAMRRTVFLVPLELAPVVLAGVSLGVADRERRKLVKMLTDAGVADHPEGWLKDVEEVALRALAARGEATAAELATDDPRLGTQLVLARGKSYEGRQNVASRVLLLLAAEGRVVRGRPLGTWLSSQYRWSPVERWCPDGIGGWTTEEAEVELARRWLASYGPATAEDLRWWTGWTTRQTKRALAGVRPVEVAVDGGTALVAPDDLEPVGETEPWAALLPALDSTPMGWWERGWYLGEHGQQLFDATGNVGPTVWWNGRVVGGWAQRPDGEIAFRLLTDTGAEAVAAVESAAGRLAAFLGPARLKARARVLSPLERELQG